MEKNTCLIIEGGGFKIGFSAGVLDAFLVSQYKPFNTIIGNSAGALAASYFQSRQFRYCLNAMLLLERDKGFTQVSRAFSEQRYMNIDFLTSVAEKHVKFNYTKALSESEKHPLFIVATNRETGEANYIAPTANNWVDTMVASSTLPFVTKGIHKIDGIDYFDGGWSDPLPVKWAYQQGARKILVVRTWPTDIRSSLTWSDYLGSKYYSSEPTLKNVFEKCHEKYNTSLDFMANPPNDLEIEQIAPIKLLKSTTYSYSRKTIMRDYRYGLDLGLRYVAQEREL